MDNVKRQTKGYYVKRPNRTITPQERKVSFIAGRAGQSIAARMGYSYQEVEDISGIQQVEGYHVAISGA